MKERQLIHPVAEALADRVGPVDMVSAWMPFDYTRYYEDEMGGPLYRRMLAFAGLIEQDGLAGIKLITNQLEREYTKGDRRGINIDPGYLTPERLVLATGKNFTHRIYLKEGIFADLTLIYTKGDFQTLPWTYPDYADARMIRWLQQVRRRYMHDMKAKS
jgi:hypothetical protein